MTTTIPTATAQAAPVPATSARAPHMTFDVESGRGGSAAVKRSAEILKEAAEGVRLQNRGGEAHGAGQTGFDFEGNAVTGSASQSDLKPSGELTVQILAMPCDTNQNGDIFGGWVVSRTDQACGIAAAARANGRVVTIAIDAMKFIRPVKVRDVLCVYAAIDRIERTSMQIHVEAWAQRFRSIRSDETQRASETIHHREATRRFA